MINDLDVGYHSRVAKAEGDRVKVKDSSGQAIVIMSSFDVTVCS